MVSLGGTRTVHGGCSTVSVMVVTSPACGVRRLSVLRRYVPHPGQSIPSRGWVSCHPVAVPYQSAHTGNLLIAPTEA